VARAPAPEEVDRLLKLLNASVDWYNATRRGKKAGKTAEEAAWTAVTRILLNLDEFLTRE
jgi:hypothetical protein